MSNTVKYIHTATGNEQIVPVAQKMATLNLWRPGTLKPRRVVDNFMYANGYVRCNTLTKAQLAHYRSLAK